MARGNGPDVYRGRRKKLNVLGIVFGAIVALLLLVVVLFFGLQKYIVFEHDGISVVLPGAESAGTSGGPGGEGTLTQVNAALTVTDPDYSSIAASAGEGLSDFTAIFVPAEDVNLSGIGKYVDVMSTYSADALVLEVKPVSGQLVWSSASSTAAAYGLNGSVDLAQLVAALRQEDPDIYLIAQLSCCIDGLLASRSVSSAMVLSNGAPYSDEEGAWVDPYSETVRKYIIELSEELIGLGFDELLYKSLTLPATGAQIGFSVQLSSTPTPETAICGLAMELTNALSGYDVPLSAILVTTSLRNGLSEQSGQNLEVFGKLFDRLCSATDSAWLSGVDRDSIDQYFELGDPAQRYVPICNYRLEGFPTSIIRVPEEVLPSEESTEENA